MSLSRFIFCLFVAIGTFELGAQTNETIDSLLPLLDKPTKSNGLQINTAIAFEYAELGDYSNSMDYIYSAKSIAEKSGNDSLKALAYFDMGDLYLQWDNYKQSAFYFNKSLLLPNGLDTINRIHANVMLGIDYSQIDLDSTAIIYYLTALNLAKEKKLEASKYYHNIYNNIGLSLMDQGYFDSARAYHDSSLTIRLANKNLHGIGQSYNNIGSLKYELGEYDSALYYYDKGLSIRIKGNINWTGIIESQLNIGKSLIELNKHSEAEHILNTAYDTLASTQNISLNLRALSFLELLYNRKGEFRQALKFNRRYHHLKDSLEIMDRDEEMVKLLSVNKYQVRFIQDSIKQVEEDRTQFIEEEQKRRTRAIVFTTFILIVLFLLSIVALVYRNLQSKKKAARIISEQKNEVELQRDIAREKQRISEEQKKLVQDQKDLLSDQNREITDSINYAQQIQHAILPDESKFDELVDEMFLFYKPRSIVAGDFYWIDSIDNYHFIAIADCTGHGVPGALVSVLSYSALNRCVHEFGLKKPDEILDKARDIIVESLSNKDNRMKDGMDISLLVLDDQSVLHWSGANNPLWVVKKDTQELIEFKGDNQPVGYYIRSEKFTRHQIQLDEGDTLYMLTDGFQDQFGGEKDKKFGTQRLKKLLIKMKDLGLADQKTELDRTLKEWMKNNMQIDDITIFGFRFK